MIVVLIILGVAIGGLGWMLGSLAAAIQRDSLEHEAHRVERWGDSERLAQVLDHIGPTADRHLTAMANRPSVRREFARRDASYEASPHQREHLAALDRLEQPAPGPFSGEQCEAPDPAQEPAQGGALGFALALGLTIAVLGGLMAVIASQQRESPGERLHETTQLIRDR